MRTKWVGYRYPLKTWRTKADAVRENAMYPVKVEFRFETVWVDCSEFDCWLKDGRRAPVKTVYCVSGKLVGPKDRTACEHEPDEIRSAWLASWEV